jgi:hypothetical protein
MTENKIMIDRQNNLQGYTFQMKSFKVKDL